MEDARIEAIIDTWLDNSGTRLRAARPTIRKDCERIFNWGVEFGSRQGVIGEGSGGSGAPMEAGGFGARGPEAAAAEEQADAGLGGEDGDPCVGVTVSDLRSIDLGRDDPNTPDFPDAGVDPAIPSGDVERASVTDFGKDVFAGADPIGEVFDPNQSDEDTEVLYTVP